MSFWMVWVPGRGAPKKMHPTLESAMEQAAELKKTTGREIHILAPVHTLPGRKLLTVSAGQSARSVKVAA